jgi:hypothetical protein
MYDRRFLVMPLGAVESPSNRRAFHHDAYCDVPDAGRLPDALFLSSLIGVRFTQEGVPQTDGMVKYS